MESHESCLAADGRAWKVDGRAQALVGPGLATPLPDSNAGLTQIIPGLIKLESCAETYSLGITDWLCVIAKIICKSNCKCVDAGYTAINQTLTSAIFICSRYFHTHNLGVAPSYSTTCVVLHMSY